MATGVTISLIVGVNRKCRGNSVDVVGKKLRDVLPRLKREIVDVEVEVEFKRRKCGAFLIKLFLTILLHFYI